MAVSVESLRRAIAALDRAISASHQLGESASPDVIEAVRGGVIQSFEVTYEQCWKAVRRWLADNGVPEEAEHPRTRKELFRIAARAGLIDDPTAWFVYGDARNLTSHTYDETQAEIVAEIAARFVGDAHRLAARLEDHDD